MESTLVVRPIIARLGVKRFEITTLANLYSFFERYRYGIWTVSIVIRIKKVISLVYSLVRDTY